MGGSQGVKACSFWEHAALSVDILENYHGGCVGWGRKTQEPSGGC